MTDDERVRILRMVAEGKLSPAEAEDLLDAVTPSRADGVPMPPVPPAAPAPPPAAVNMRPGRAVTIRIQDGTTTNVNLRIPLGLLKAAGKFIPRQAQRQLEGYDIDLEELLKDMVNSPVSGAMVHIQDDETEVYIGVE